MKTIVLSLIEMQDFLLKNKKELDKYNISGIISINDPGGKCPNNLKYAVDSKIPCLVLHFSDLEYKPDHERMDYYWNMVQNKHGKDAIPSVGNVKKIVDFVKGIDKDGVLLVHCHAGISRSTATALIANTVINGPDSSGQVFEEIEKDNPWMTPNKSLLEFAEPFIGDDAGNLIRLCLAKQARHHTRALKKPRFEA